MQSKNPVFARADGFNGRNAQGNATYPGNGQDYSGYGSPSQWGTGTSGGSYGTTVDQGRMTIDSVVQKTAMTLGLTILVAVVTWVGTGELSESTIGTLYLLSMVGAFGGFALSMV